MPTKKKQARLLSIGKLFKNKLFWFSLAIAVIFAAVPFLNVGFIYNAIRQKSVDYRFLLRGPVEPSGQVAVAYVDEKSIKALGRWPWSRSVIAALIQQLNDYGVKAIGFDVLFTDPEVTPQLELLGELADAYMAMGLLNEKPENQAYFEQLNQALDVANNDQLMAATMLERENVVLGMALLPYEEKTEEFPPYLVNAAYSQFDNPAGVKSFLPTVMPGRSLPIPVLAEASRQMGFVNTFADSDGAIRRQAMVLLHDEVAFASLGLRLAQVYQDVAAEDVVLHFSKKVQMGNLEVPISEDGFTYINYYGPNLTIPAYSVIDILEQTVEPEKLKGKAVMVGGAAVGMADIWPNPFSPGFLGVEKQATVVENVLEQAFIKEPDWVNILAAAEVLCFGLLLGIVFPLSTTLWAIPVTLFCLLAHAVSVQVAFVNYKLLLNFAVPAIYLVVAYLSLSAIKYFTEERDKKFLKNTFSSYLSPELIDEMYDNKMHPQLGGEAKIITAFFTDIQGFSTFSEKLTAHQLVELLNEYLTEMTDILIGEKGTLDKYEGDAIIAFFGAPMELLDQEIRACRVAVQMQARLDELRKKWQGEKIGPGEPNPNARKVPEDQWHRGNRWPTVVHEMRMRIGINTGEIVVGNMGSTTRMNYTMMGDPVNLSARLEAAAKQYGVYNLVSEYTLDVEYMDESGEPKRVMDAVETRYLDRITVVGKSEPVRVYELIAMKGECSDKDKELIRLFEAGMRHYQNMEWDKAIEQFSQSYSLERFPFEKTTPSEVLIYRCRQYKEDPPVKAGQAWDGVFRLIKK